MYNPFIVVPNPFYCSLIDDIRSERLAKLNMRKSLEQSWDHNMQERQGQLMEEINHSKQPSILLHQQCEKYHRSEMNQVEVFSQYCMWFVWSSILHKEFSCIKELGRPLEKFDNNIYCFCYFAGANSVSVVCRTRENRTYFMRVATSLARDSWSKLAYTMHVVNNRELCVLLLSIHDCTKKLRQFF